MTDGQSFGGWVNEQMLLPEKRDSQTHTHRLREDIHKKRFFLVVGPLRFYPFYTNGLVVHATVFSFFF